MKLNPFPLLLSLSLALPALAGEAERLALLRPAPIKGITGHGVSAPLPVTGHSTLTGHATPPTAPAAPLRTPTLQANDRVVFAGDSITWLGTYSNTIQGWLLQWQSIAQQSCPDLTVFNSGIPGNTSAQLAARFNTTVLNVHPTVVVIWCSANDIGHHLAMSTTQNDFLAMINACKVNGVREIILVPTECIEESLRSGAIDTEIDSFASWLRQVAVGDPSGQVYYCPMREYLRLMESLLNPHHVPEGILTFDGVHPSALGQEFITDVFCSEFGLIPPYQIAGQF